MRISRMMGLSSKAVFSESERNARMRDKIIPKYGPKPKAEPPMKKAMQRGTRFVHVDGQRVRFRF